MSPRDAFKFGFMLRCAEEGLTPTQVAERTKQAAEKSALLDGISSGLGAAALLGLGLPIAGGALAGGLGGHALSQVGDPNYSAEDINGYEMLDLYNQLADDAETQAQLNRLARRQGR